MIYNYTKCESVIAKIMADLDSTETRNRVSDIREWIFEAIDKIGAPMQYIKKESGTDSAPILKIEDNQVPLPADLQVLDGVAYSTNPDGPWTPMNKSTAVFNQPTRQHHGPKHIHTALPHDPENKAIEDTVLEVHEHQPMNHKQITSQSQLYTINGMKYLDRMIGRYDQMNKPEYFIKPGWLVTNMKQGFIKLAYKAIATDERGYPLIPDLTSYQEAIYWYVVMKLSFSKWLKGSLGGHGRKGVNTGQNIYTYVQQQWNFYRNQAYAEAMMPTADDMRGIQNEWNRLMPEFESGDTFFKHLNKRELIYDDYYNGY